MSTTDRNDFHPDVYPATVLFQYVELIKCQLTPKIYSRATKHKMIIHWCITLPESRYKRRGRSLDPHSDFWKIAELENHLRMIFQTEYPVPKISNASWIPHLSNF